MKREEAIRQAMASIENRMRHIYNQGYEDGRKSVQKVGKWVRQADDYHDYYECENCGIAVGLDDVKNYCPKCGLRMVLDENDEKHKICEERKQNCYECPFEDDCVEYRW